MSYSADTVVILGLGLIGGSLARALRRSGFSQCFIGYGHREPSLRRGVELGVIDEFTLDLDEALDRADIMVVCTPTLVASTMLERILPALAGRTDGPVVTDAASVKGSLLQTAPLAPFYDYEDFPGPDVQTDDEFLDAARSRGTTTTPK